MNRHANLTAGYLALALLCGPLANAQITGPPGPPGSDEARMKSLNQVEPRHIIGGLPVTIVEPGAYYLIHPLVCTDGNGITIACDDVELDLNGLSLEGQAGSSNGVFVAGTRHNITIRNGTIRYWRGAGLDASNANESRLECVTVYTNNGAGIMIGENALVTGCGAFKNGGNGIQAGTDATVRDCKARDNGGNGILVSARSKIIDCSASGNSHAGIAVDSYCTVRECLATQNVQDGILAMSKCRIINNDAGENSQNGIRLQGSGSRVDGNNVTDNGTGIFIDDNGGFGNLIVRNTASGNTNGYATSTIGDFLGQVLAGPEIQGNEFSTTDPWANFEF